MPERVLSRRDFLKAAVAIGGSLLLDACAKETIPTTPFKPIGLSEKTDTPQPTETKLQETSTPTEISPDPVKWKEWPIVPERIDPKIIDIYNQGITEGLTDPHKFSKAGDCHSVPTSGFLFGQFDKPGRYNLGVHKDLAAAIEWFEGSWSRFPPTVHGGQNAAGILLTNSLIRYENNGQQDCSSGQSYLDCEIEAWNPSLLLISYEQELDSLDNYKKFLNMVVTETFNHKIIPIVTTSANSEEMNSKVAEVASENRIPLWNFWRAVQPLEHIFDPGLNDGFHLSWAGEKRNFDFTDPNPTAWNVRNLTGAQTIKAVLTMLNSDFREYEENS